MVVVLGQEHRDGHIVVVGSINMDLVGRTERMPRGGETLLGSDFRMVPGGKGANQAVAVARAGGNVKMLGRVGTDIFGEQHIANFRDNGIDTDLVQVTPDTPTGVAIILVDNTGENSIVVVPGANNHVLPEDLETARNTLETAKVVLVQLEIPLDTVEAVVRIAKQAGVPVILDPGPARPLKEELLAQVDILTPNEHEAQVLAGEEMHSADDTRQIATKLLGYGCKIVLLKLGGKGVIIATPEGMEHIPAHAVNVEDTTAAGDAFAGGLAVALAEGYSLRNAVLFANAVGALAVTRLGAQSAIPTRPEIEAFMKERGVILM
ncbi:MAG: ribokinase [Firmicutes bacterium]|nr:ribokinase [Bacillota bacterium]